MPLDTSASAAARMSFSLTLQPNLFQLFQPMGGVRARPSPARASGAIRTGTNRAKPTRTSERMISPVAEGAQNSTGAHHSSGGFFRTFLTAAHESRTLLSGHVVCDHPASLGTAA